MKYHFIGDRGVSMRGLKDYMQHLGHNVSGSDLKTGGHLASNVDSDTDFVVRTSAVSPGSPGWVEVEAATKLGIPVIKRSELLGEITKGKKLIAVSGMHGKTTVTSLIGLTLIKAGFDPTVLVGEEVEDFGGVLRIGNSEWFVAEVCDYDRSFLDVSPSILILTNIEEEHLDTYPGGLPEIKEAFGEYVSRVVSEGVIVACADDKNVIEVVKSVPATVSVIYYGGQAEVQKIDIALSGRHNRLNALAVLALADHLKIDRQIVLEVLANFRGAHRRFEFKGTFNGDDVIDDYGHHPTEIAATMQALAEKYPSQKKIVVFWPHQYKRVKSLLKQFAEALSQADEVILKPIYFVPGRDEKLDVASEDIADLINQGKIKKARVLKTDDDIVSYLSTHLAGNEVVLTMGIPPVYQIADRLTAQGTRGQA